MYSPETELRRIERFWKFKKTCQIVASKIKKEAKKNVLVLNFLALCSALCLAKTSSWYRGRHLQGSQDPQDSIPEVPVSVVTHFSGSNHLKSLETFFAILSIGNGSASNRAFFKPIKLCQFIAILRHFPSKIEIPDRKKVFYLLLTL